jgi:6-pyruvoyltetrahydropterin/6-carboxytetrahydropterin synthase
LIYITRKFHFSAAHRVFNPKLSDEENYRIYGKCSNPNGHGHNYIMKITVAGSIDETLGYVMDLTELKHLVEKEIINKVDHRNLNMDVDFMKNILPTTENLAMKFWEQIEGKINNKNRKLYSVQLRETDNNSVEYKGGE